MTTWADFSNHLVNTRPADLLSKLTFALMMDSTSQDEINARAEVLRAECEKQSLLPQFDVWMHTNGEVWEHDKSSYTTLLNAHGQFNIFSARELQDREIEPIRWVVADLLPPGLAMLCAPPKYGKSWLTLDLCLSVASGGRFLEHTTAKSRCLYLALEDSERRLQDRMNTLLHGERAPDGFDYTTNAPNVDNGLMDMLESYVAQHPDARLIVIDTLQKVRGASGGRESAYESDYRQMSNFKSFADKHNVCVLLVHHLRKMKDDGDAFNRISGTNGIFGALDTALVMDRANRNDRETTLSVTGRDIDSDELILLFDNGQWSVLGKSGILAEQYERQQYDANAVSTTIRRLVAQGGGTWSGTMQDLMSAGTYITKTTLAESARALTKRVQDLEHQLFIYDGIQHDTTRNGNAGKKHRFYKVASEQATEQLAV